jgi:hypothetical protein
MVGWYDLPLEVVDAILSSLAGAIVKDYRAQGYSFILDEPNPTRKVPQPLRNFSNCGISAKSAEHVIIFTTPSQTESRSMAKLAPPHYKESYMKTFLVYPT